MNTKVEYASITDKGLGPKSAVNEDSFLVLEDESVFAVADGVGGAQAGDVASQGALRAIKKNVQSAHSDNTAQNPIELVKRLIKTGNDEVCRLANDKQLSMASTIALLTIRGNALVLAHVGDSRIYLFRDGELLQLTKDHSKLQQLLDRMPPNTIDIDNYEDSNVITRALGVEAQVEPDIQKVNLKNKDIFLLCTDGIYNYNSAEEIKENLAKNSDNPEEICLTLKETCYSKGAKDHLTAVVVIIACEHPDLRETINLTRKNRDSKILK